MKYILDNAKSEDIVIISNRITAIYSEPINTKQKKLYKEALFFDINGESISRLESLELWFKDLDIFLEKANERNILVIYVLPVPEFIESARLFIFSQ